MRDLLQFLEMRSIKPFSLLSDAISSSAIVEEMEPLHELVPTTSGDLGATFFKMLFTFVALIALLFITYWFLRKLIRNRLQKGVGSTSIHVLEKKMISAKTMLYLVEIENKQILLAESQLEIKKLETFPLDLGKSGEES